MVPDDLEEVLSLALAEGWVSDMCELSLILRSYPEGCSTAVSECQVVGCVMVTRYEHSAWIGNLIVDRHYRMRGVGTELLQTAMVYLDNDSTITSIYLNAAPTATRLYERFGFVTVCNVFRWKKNGISGSFSSSRNAAQLAASSSQETGMCRREDILWLDSQCWGDCRSVVLKQLIKERSCITSKDPTAFLMYYKISGMPESLYAIGPWEVENGGQEIASGLLERALSQIGDAAVVLDVPAQNDAACDVLQAAGFMVVGRTVFMCHKKVPDIRFGNVLAFLSMGSMG